MNEDNVEQHRLALELGEWTVTLEAGDQIRLRAHAYVDNETDVMFHPHGGHPAFYIDILWIPRSLVADIVGG